MGLRPKPRQGQRPLDPINGSKGHGPWRGSGQSHVLPERRCAARLPRPASRMKMTRTRPETTDVRMKRAAIAFVAATGRLAAAHAQDAPAASAGPDGQLPTVEITATRMPEPVNRVPADVTIITGDDLRARHATDLRS